jgi:hypothetical protein
MTELDRDEALELARRDMADHRAAGARPPAPAAGRRRWFPRRDGRRMGPARVPPPPVRNPRPETGPIDAPGVWA